MGYGFFPVGIDPERQPEPGYGAVCILPAGIRPLEAGAGIPDARRSLSQHYKLTLVAEGTARFSCSSGTHVLHSSDVVLMAPFIPYEVRMDPEDGLDMFYLYFEVTPASSLPAFSQLFQCTDAALYPGLIDPALRIMLEQNLDLYQRGTPGQFLSLQLLLTRLMLVMRQRSDGLPAPRRAAQVSNGERVVQECVEYLDEHMRKMYRCRICAKPPTYPRVICTSASTR